MPVRVMATPTDAAVGSRCMLHLPDGKCYGTPEACHHIVNTSGDGRIPAAISDG